MHPLVWLTAIPFPWEMTPHKPGLTLPQTSLAAPNNWPRKHAPEVPCPFTCLGPLSLSSVVHTEAAPQSRPIQRLPGYVRPCLRALAAGSTSGVKAGTATKGRGERERTAGSARQALRPAASRATGQRSSKAERIKDPSAGVSGRGEVRGRVALPPGTLQGVSTGHTQIRGQKTWAQIAAASLPPMRLSAAHSTRAPVSSSVTWVNCSV